MRNEDRRNIILQDSWDDALHCFGTAYVFERKIPSLKNKLKWLSFLGIAIPVLIGGSVLSFGTNFKYLSIIIAVTSIIGLIQLIVSVWSLVAKWDDQLAYALESKEANYILSGEYKKLAESPPSDLSELQREYEVLEAKNQMRSSLDGKQEVSAKEKRLGMRAGLYQFKRKCSTCKQIPRSMQATDCTTCGNF